jgi:hypothetical protein
MIVRRKFIVKACTSHFASLMMGRFDVSGLELIPNRVRTLLKSRMAVKTREISREKRGSSPNVFQDAGRFFSERLSVVINRQCKVFDNRDLHG